MSQTKEKQSNQLPLPQRGEHTARQDQSKTTVKQRAEQHMKNKPHNEQPQNHTKNEQY